MRFVLAILILAATPTSGHGQSADSLLHHAARNNWYVRVTDAAGRVAEGRNPRLDRDSVDLAGVRLDLDETVRIDRRLRSKSGALAGGLLGGAAMGIFGWAFATGMCEYDCGGGSALYALAGGAAIGFGFGTAVGALVSPGEVSWRQELPRTMDEGVALDTLRASPRMKGSGLRMLAGIGMIAEDQGADSYPTVRLALQLSSAAGSTGASEIALEGNTLLIPDGGLLLGVNAGPNIVRPGGGYFGASAGVATAGGGPVFNLGIRGGKRPLRRAGLRAEVRGDYYFWGDSGNAVSATVSLGLQTH